MTNKQIKQDIKELKTSVKHYQEQNKHHAFMLEQNKKHIEDMIKFIERLQIILIKQSNK